MKQFVILAVAATAAFATPVLAQATAPDQSSLSTKEMTDSPGTKGGFTTDPVAKPDTNTLSGKVQADTPGARAGASANTTQPDTTGGNASSTSAIRDNKAGVVGGKN